MMKTYEEKFTLKTRDCDMFGQWRPGAILECMQEVAGIHSQLLGCGREELLRHDTVWVLSRCELHMDRYPKIGETIQISTFPMPTRMYFFPRYYLFTDAQGELIGKAGTLWLLLDLNTRHMLPPGDVARLIPDNRDLSVPMKLPATVGQLQGEEFLYSYEPVFTDFDVNLHVNNTRYADWLCNALGMEILSEFEPENLVLNYNSEIRPHQTVHLRKILRERRFQLSGLVDEHSAFEIGGLLRKKTD